MLEAAKGQAVESVIGRLGDAGALGQGFLHAARFSAYYCAAVGEYPKQTLARGRLRRSDAA